MIPAILSLVITILVSFQFESQPGSVTFRIVDGETSLPLAGATVFIRESERGGSADEEGMVTLRELPYGRYSFEFRFVGYETSFRVIDIPASEPQPVIVRLEHEHDHLDEITVSTTRTTRSIEDSPTRVEAITLEEIEEKANMRPGDIRMLLAESTGIQVQQTSPVSGSSNFRIQGLDGRYTQLLIDGFPLYDGFSGGLSIMQIPPLDLQQVEIIKGSNSTLYGGGAIAGLVNLISKQPSHHREVSFLANASTSNNLDFSGFYSEKTGNIGVTLFSAYNRNPGYDPSGQGFSAVPEYDRFTLNPKLIWYVNERTHIMAASRITIEDRLGGDMLYINGEDPGGRYFEQHNTRRISTQFSIDHNFSDKTTLTLKNSLSLLDRSIQVPGFLFDGNQTASFSELSVNHKSAYGIWSAGFNLWTDRFDERAGQSTTPQDVQTDIVGAFIQNTASYTEKLSVEAGIRADLVRPEPGNDLNGLFVLPRVSALYRFDSSWSMRLGGGMGYKTPGIFTDDAENRAFRNVAPPDFSTIKAEKSYGLNYDVNFRTVLADRIVFRFNQLLFVTRLDHPLMLMQDGDDVFRFSNMDGFIRSLGSETNVAFIVDPLKLFFGYTHIDASQHQDGFVSRVPLNSPHQINAILMLEEHDSYRLGFEAYYYSPQKLTDSSTGRGYTIFGIMGEKTWGIVTVFANFENIFDTRQTRYGLIYSGTRQNPEFSDIFAPLEGRYVNIGVRIKL
ncbi:MAG: TonB-dependent receptor [Balneolaceae bacterium]|nr:MAG: TonB-dependent receptor [Balneolaceae bacterium]